MKNAALFAVLIPRNLGVLLLRGYRAAISPLYGDVCRYYPSCSAYGLGSVQQRGILIGAALTVWRILRCNPWTAGGIDDVRAATHSRYRITRFGWVVPAGWADAATSAEYRADSAHGTHSHRGTDSYRGDDSHHGTAELALSSPTMSRKD
ncbi:membrane protein insertion efficiency factor YidD [Agromyces laixinhei]|uniref:membrane protein insertion efficiency factor YidD n=1 Tax=Agromyces laixinhei TaxID=2585717 RepID=UPI0012ED4DBA|nr:membrane protein insertion efficiency factor YidD [Agromyces laixinhei]